MINAERDLLRLLPAILRARDYHLYLEGGKRITDLWLQGGKAVLGHKPPNVLRELKNAGERGLMSALPHGMEKRFIKALNVFFPGRAFRIYADESSLSRALENAGYRDFSIMDPAIVLNEKKESPGKNNIYLWRPFLEDAENFRENSFLIPVLPWPLSPMVLVLNQNIELGPGDIIPPALLAPATRALYDLHNVKNPGNYTKLNKALKKSIWQLKGIYLSVKEEMSREQYADLFKRFLEGGFLIPPSKAEPAILPAFMSGGEEAKLAMLLDKP